MADRPRVNGRWVSIYKDGCCNLGHELIKPNLVEANLRQGRKVCKACSRARKRIQSSFRPGRNPLLGVSFEIVAHKNYQQIMGKELVLT